MTAKEIVAQVTNLPVMPSATVKLLQFLENPMENTQAALEIIQNDVVLSAKLLRLCNSAAIGLRKPVASVDQAVFFLGFREVQRLALALGVGGSLKRKGKCREEEAHALWHHSVMTAHAATLILPEIRPLEVDSSIAFTAGLMHDIGKLVLAEALTPEMLLDLRNRVTGGTSLWEAERAVLGASHSDVGAYLLQTWHLPQILVEPAGNHHNPTFEPDQQLSVVIHIADCVVHQIDKKPAWPAFAEHVNQAAAASVGFGAPQLAFVLQSLTEQVEKVTQFAQAA